MKKTLIVVTLLFSLYSAPAQFSPHAFIKWAPASLAVGKLTFAGELNVSRHNSIELVVGIPKQVDRQMTFDSNTNTLHSKAFSIMGGYRRYLGRRDAAGFYIEPYVKYVKQETSGLLRGTAGGETALFDSYGTYEGIGVGAQLGMQFIIAKRISLDFFLLGPEANSSSFNAHATDVASNIPWTYVKAQDAQNKIRNFISDVPIVGKKTEVQVDQSSKTVTVKYNGFLPGIRVGASIGVRI